MTLISCSRVDIWHNKRHSHSVSLILSFLSLIWRRFQFAVFQLYQASRVSAPWRAYASGTCISLCTKFQTIPRAHNKEKNTNPGMHCKRGVNHEGCVAQGTKWIRDSGRVYAPTRWTAWQEDIIREEKRTLNLFSPFFDHFSPTICLFSWRLWIFFALVAYFASSAAHYNLQNEPKIRPGVWFVDADWHRYRIHQYSRDIEMQK